MCHLMVASPTCIASPISLFDRLRASNSSTSRSFGVSAMLGVARSDAASGAGRGARIGAASGPASPAAACDGECNA